MDQSGFMKGYFAFPRAPELEHREDKGVMTMKEYSVFPRTSEQEHRVDMGVMAIKEYSVFPRASELEHRVDMGVMAMKEYSVFPRASELEHYHQMLLGSYPGNLLMGKWRVSSLSAKIQSLCSTSLTDCAKETKETDEEEDGKKIEKIKKNINEIKAKQEGRREGKREIDEREKMIGV